ncbi:MAG: HAMP domain-containing sensor histidine kinase [Actinomycetaceae bacterium]|nr:HAMP domain-containing sensor histidine kinase [Actinomycetaceae bacterium]
MTWFLLVLAPVIFICGFVLGKKSTPPGNGYEISGTEILAHDIRTPLSLLQGASELLLEESTGQLSADQQRFVDVIHSNTIQISALAEAFLTESKLQAGYQPKFSKVDIRALIREVGRQLREINTIPIYLADTGEPLFVQADPTLLRQIAWNLINNAARHSRSGDQIEVSTYATTGGAVLKITDFGEGVKEETLSHIYTPFTTYTSNNPTNVPPGIGLGMGIVKRAVAIHGGKIAIDSITSKGTSIHVTFPWDAKG